MNYCQYLKHVSKLHEERGKTPYSINTSIRSRGPSPSVPSDTLQRGKLALGMQANGSPVDELRTEPATETAHVLCDFAATGPAELSVSRTLSLAPSP